MRVLIVSALYPDFLGKLYGRNSPLVEKSYSEQVSHILKQFFGSASSYVRELCKLNQQADVVYFNAPSLQKQWAREAGIAERVSFRFAWQRRKTLGISVPFIRIKRHPDRRDWLLSVLGAQIESLNPDIILNHIPGLVTADNLRRLSPKCPLVAQIAAPIPKDNWHGYDLVLSSLPNFVEYFSSLGVRSRFHALGFDSEVVANLPRLPRDVDVSFVGSFFDVHGHRRELLQKVARELPLDLWGHLPQGQSTALSNVNCRIHEPVWGLEMYRILARSKMTLNIHIDVSGEYANNLRLFEATGMGALLVTDQKKNLGQYFKVGEEIVAFEDALQCKDLLHYYSSHEKERIEIAEAGRKRTISEHSVGQRMIDLIHIFEELMDGQKLRRTG